MGEEELAGAFGGEVAAFVPGQPGVQGQGTQRNETLGEG
jgi:hypothetical protein